MFGKELILDIYDCKSLPCDRDFIQEYFVKLCILIDMQREDLHFWDYEGLPDQYNEAPPHLKGISAVQFIKTSNITVHTLDELKQVYLNIFSCKDFEMHRATEFSRNYFQGGDIRMVKLFRGSVKMVQL